MNLKEDIKSISYVKSHTAEILNQVNNTHRPIIVTQNGEAKAVILDTESYESMNKAIGLLKIISQSEKDIINGDIVEQNKAFVEIEKKYFK